MFCWVHVWSHSWQVHNDVMLVRNATVSRATYDGALFYTDTQFRTKTPLPHGSMWFLKIGMYRCLFVVPSRITEWLFPPCWILMGRDFHALAECKHRSPSRLASGVLEPYHHYGHDDVTKWKHFPRYWPFCPGEFPSQRPVTRSFDVFLWSAPDKRLSKQLWGWWFETLSRSLWRHCNGITKTWTDHWRCSVSRDEGPRLGASGPTHDDVAYAPKSILDIWSGRTPESISSSQKSTYNNSGSHVPAETPNHLHPQTRSINEKAHPDHTKQVAVLIRRRHILSTWWRHQMESFSA